MNIILIGAFAAFCVWIAWEVVKEPDKDYTLPPLPLGKPPNRPYYPHITQAQRTYSMPEVTPTIPYVVTKPDPDKRVLPFNPRRPEDPPKPIEKPVEKVLSKEEEIDYTVPISLGVEAVVDLLNSSTDSFDSPSVDSPSADSFSSDSFSGGDSGGAGGGGDF